MSSKYNLFSLIYGAYTWMIFFLCLILALIGVSIIPTLNLRRRWVKKTARLIFILCGIKMDIDGLKNIPEGRVLLVANHASYLDGVSCMLLSPQNLHLSSKVKCSLYLLQIIYSNELVHDL